jgi:osmotically-inducible protein OsmY
MNTLAKFKLIGMSLLIVGGLTACDKPGPAETAGKKLDQTVNKAGDKIADTADRVGDKVTQQTTQAGVVLNDAEITTKIKAAIFAEPGLNTLQISVDTLKGEVTLSGSVDTQQNSDRAKALAGAVSGVHEVKNLLVLKSVK